MAKVSNSEGDDLPSYSESVTAPQHIPSTLPQNIAQARSALVTSLLTTHVAPHLYNTSLSGLSSTTLLLVPSNVSTLQPSSSVDSKGTATDGLKFQGESIEGFFSTENLTIVRLRGRENSVEFWRQPAVIRELEQQLREHLRRQGHRVLGVDDVASPTNSHAAVSTRAGFFKKKSNAEWKMPHKEALADGEVRTEVDIKDICLRIENEMGLYETRTGKAIAVKVDSGG